MTQNPAEVSTTAPRREPWPLLNRFVSVVLAQMLAGFAVTAVTTGFNRAALFLVVVPFVSSLLCLSRRFRSKASIVIVAAATASTFAIVYLLRQTVDSTWFIGSAPPNLELVAYGVLLIITTSYAACVCKVMSSRGMLHRFRWVVVGMMAVLLVGLAIAARFSVREVSPADLLLRIASLEQGEPTDALGNQELSVFLAICGRETEAEAVSRWSVVGGRTLPRSRTHDIDIGRLDPLPWRQTLAEIAEQESLILIMEAHNAPRHRQWIEQSLPVLQAAGFRDYAAEGLTEPGPSLRRRGYPTFSSGFYVLDPHFGNVLRTAIDLGFDLHAYESYGTDFEQREYEQAANLARLLSADPRMKLLVHAGYGHVYKKPDGTGQKSMAAWLWEMTGTEPYCICQTYHSVEEGEARQLGTLAEAAGEPVMLVPVPSDLKDPQFRFPSGAVDALVVHPASVGGPAERVHGFRSVRRRIAGRWHGSEWPVLIGAFKRGEPADAIALDQVMLRHGERDFALWVPDDDYEVRAFDVNGRVDAARPEGSPRWELNLSRS